MTIALRAQNGKTRVPSVILRFMKLTQQ